MYIYVSTRTVRLQLKPWKIPALFREARNAVNELARTNKVIIAWIPGHSGYKGSERADTLAKQGVESSEQLK